MVKKAAKKDEQVLFYQFSDMDKLTAIREVLDKLHIRSQMVPEAGYRQKVGYLLGLKGFSAVQPQDDDDFVFPHDHPGDSQGRQGGCPESPSYKEITENEDALGLSKLQGI